MNELNGQPTLDAYLSQATFSVDLCNTVLVMWILKHALPFNRFYDVPLRAAFKLANRRAELRTPTWAAGVAKELYLSLSSAAIALVFNNSSKFLLVHDVWTTKGNQYDFIGVLANYIDDNWNYKTIHLSLKLVSWNKFGFLLAQPVARFLIAHGLHKKMLGQTTDSGSSNNTMAREMEVMFSECNDSIDWDSSKNHVWCFAHKLGLIVKKGLKVLGLAAGQIKPSTPLNASVPIPTVLLNDDLTEDVINYDESDDEDDLLNPKPHCNTGNPALEDDIDDDLSYEDVPIDACIFVKGAMKLKDFNALLTRSNARRGEFHARADQMGYHGPGPIAGWGVRWNINLAMYSHLVAARDVVDLILIGDRKARYYNGIMMSMDEWDAVDSLCKVLEIFRLSTKRMEGNTISGSMLLAEYLRVKESLAELRTTAMPSSLQHMVAVMLSQLAVYQDKALSSDVVILATVLNPKYWVRFFELHYPDYAGRAKQLIEEVFNASLENWPVTPACTPSPTPTAESDKTFDQFDLFTYSATLQTAESIWASELESYLQGSNLIVPGQTELSWWDQNQSTFQVLASLARDYLSILATSCALERTFSSAADIAVPGQGSLKPKTISRAVGCREWLRAGIMTDVKDKFFDALMYLSSFASHTQK